MLRKIKKWVYTLSSLVLIGTQFLPSTIYAVDTVGNNETAMSRVINQIKLSALGLKSSDSELNMSNSELKTVGFFLSNYYSPFVSQVGGKYSQKELVEVLTKSVGLAEDSAKEIASGVIANQGSSLARLKLYNSNDGGKTWSESGTIASYHDILFGSAQIMSDDVLNSDGEFSLKKRYKWKDSNTILGIADPTFATGGAIDKKYIRYSWNPSSNGTPTVAQTIFYANFKAVNSSNTFGSSFMTIYSKDEKEQAKISDALTKGKPTEALYNVLIGDREKDKTIKEFYRNSIYSSRMYTDAFGNLIASSGSSNSAKYFVVLPASQNPMNFALNTDTSGNQEGDYDNWFKSVISNESNGSGKVIPVNNLNTIALIDKGLLNIDNSGGDATISASVDKAVTPYVGSDLLGFDEGIGRDLGSHLNDLLITQFLINRVSYVDSDTKKTLTDIFTNKSKVNGRDFAKLRYSGLSDIISQNVIPELTYNNLSGEKAYLLYPNNQWLQSTTNYKTFEFMYDALGRPKPAYYEQFKSKGGDADIIKFKSSLSSSGKLLDVITGFDKFMLNSSTWDGIDAVGDVIVESHLLNGSSLSITGTNKIEDGNWVGSSSDGSINSTGILTGEVDKKYSINLYVSYLLARANPKTSPFVINLEGTPTVDASISATGTDDLSDDEKDKVLKNMLYYLMNPTLGRQYKERLSKTLSNSVITSMLRDVVGANSSSTYGGSTRYLDLNGFGTIPRLSEIKLTEDLYKNFDTIGIILLLITLLLGLYFIFTKQIGILTGILVICSMGFVIYTPPKLIDSLSNISNSISSTFFKDKFVFWTLYQHQNYEDSLSQLADYGAEGDSNSYNSLLLQLQGGNGNNPDVYEWQQSLGSVVKLRWMSPKKDGYVEQAKRSITKGLEVANNSATGVSDPTGDNLTASQDGGDWTGGGLISSLTRSGLSNQDYTGLDTNYMYRGYTDISDYSRFYYGNIMGDNLSGNGNVQHQIGSYEESLSTLFNGNNDYGVSASIKLQDQKLDMLSYLSTSGGEDSLKDRASKGFINDRQSAFVGDFNKQYLKRIYAPISSTTVSSVAGTNLEVTKMGDTVGLSQNYFMASIRDFNNHSKSFSSILAELNKGYGGTTMDSGDAVSLSTFGLYTESPFYYFSWYLYDQGLKTTKGSSNEFKKMLLENNDSFFYNYKIAEGSAGYGAMKDFMDFGSLFKVIIPYLRESNKPLLEWSDKFGTKPFEGYGSDIKDLDAISDKNSEAYYKTWHNVMSNNLYRTYSAWVDSLYSLDIARPEEITYGGKKQTVKEPLNPASYTIRPMIFSESEMDYYGVKEYELTQVERKIIATLRGIRNDWLNLINFYQLDDVVLNTASAMIVTFNFNKNFSQNGIMQNQVTLEPLGYELKTFSWDAYLRLILQKATGESIQYNKELNADIYAIVSEKDGNITAVGLLLISIAVSYILPTLQTLILIVLPMAMILSVLASYIRRDNRAAKVFTRDCLVPFISVLLVNIFMSWSVSNMMGDAGSTLVTGDLSGSINVTSLRVTMGILSFIVAVAVSVYFIGALNLVKGVRANGKVIAIPIKGAVQGLGAITFSSVTNRMGNIINGGIGLASNGVGAMSRGIDRVRGFSSKLNPSEQSEENLSSGRNRFKNRFNYNNSEDESNKAVSEAEQRVNDILSDNKKPKTFKDLMEEENKPVRDVPKDEDTSKKVSDIFKG